MPLALMNSYVAHFVERNTLYCFLPCLCCFFLRQFMYYKVHPLRVYSSVDLVYSQLCNHHRCLISEHYHPARKKTPCPSAVCPHSLLSSASGNHLIYFLFRWICLFWTFHVTEILHSIALCLDL